MYSTSISLKKKKKLIKLSRKQLKSNNYTISCF